MIYDFFFFIRKSSFVNRKSIIIPLLVVFSFLFLVVKAHALTMSNNNWVIQMGNFNMSSGKPTGPNNKLGFTMGQTGPGLYGTAIGDNFKVKSGFQYIHSIIRFRFSISSLYIDFGNLTPTNPVIRNNVLTVTNGSSSGYTVAASESGQLTVPSSGAFIPDTTCDSGTCNETNSAVWDNILTYGFGYRCDNVNGTDCVSGFTDPLAYKQFADGSKNELPKAVMKGVNVGKNKQVRITYKVNVSGTQAAGEYRNFITYIAAPNF